MSLAWVSRWVELVVPSKMELLLYWVRVHPGMPPIAIATQIDCHKLFLLHDLHIFAWLYDFSSFSCMIPIRLSWAMWRHLVTNKIQTRLHTWMLFFCDLFDNIAPFKYLGETCYVEFTRRCPTEVARGAKRWETRQICFLPSLWYVWQNTSFTNMNFFLEKFATRNS